MIELPVNEIPASAHGGAFGPEGLIDGDKRFGGWLSGADGWQNAWLSFGWSEPVPVRAVEIVNGFVEKSGRRNSFYRHLRAAEIVLTFDGTITRTIRLDDINGPVIFSVGLGAPAVDVELNIRGVHRGGPTPRSRIKPLEVVGFRQVTWLAKA